MRLEQKHEVALKIKTEFQFHKGAIRTFNGALAFAFASRFQFHKGAIRTAKFLKSSIIDNVISIP